MVSLVPWGGLFRFSPGSFSVMSVESIVFFVIARYISLCSLTVLITFL